MYGGSSRRRGRSDLAVLGAALGPSGCAHSPRPSRARHGRLNLAVRSARIAAGTGPRRMPGGSRSGVTATNPPGVAGRLAAQTPARPPPVPGGYVSPPGHGMGIDVRLGAGGVSGLAIGTRIITRELAAVVQPGVASNHVGYLVIPKSPGDLPYSMTSSSASDCSRSQSGSRPAPAHRRSSACLGRCASRRFRAPVKPLRGPESHSS